MTIAESSIEIQQLSPPEALLKILPEFPLHFLLESKQVSLFSGRFSLLGFDPILKISGKNDRFEIRLLHERGRTYFEKIANLSFPFAEQLTKEKEIISGISTKEFGLFDESKRSKRGCTAQVIRLLLETFSREEKSLLGLYGAFSYDFIRLFEEIGDHLPVSDVNDFTLFLFDSFIFFDHIKEKTILKLYRNTQKELEKDGSVLQELLSSAKPARIEDGHIDKGIFSLSEEQFKQLVDIAKNYIRDGEFVQVVFSNIFRAPFTGHPFSLYLKYRDINPSPYLFYFELGEEQLVGASPEMMVRCEDGQVHLRPIAGTAKRGKDPIEDHDLMLELLNSPKERAELEMLIDLGRSDLSRICKPGIEISDYRFVEKYSRVMHTVTHLTGTLREGFSGFDALVSCLNAGTVTGAPKVAAMRAIEKHEKERRQYYGGAIGQLTFSGEVDTAIIIRTAHIRNGILRYQSGAGIVYDSDPQKEYEETLHKSKAFRDIFASV